MGRTFQGYPASVCIVYLPSSGPGVLIQQYGPVSGQCVVIPLVILVIQHYGSVLGQCIMYLPCDPGDTVVLSCIGSVLYCTLLTVFGEYKIVCGVSPLWSW